MIDRWNCRLVQVSPGIHERQPLSDVETWVESTDGQLYRLDAFANYTVEEELRIGQIPLNDMRGFVNHQSGEIVTRGLNTEILDLETLAEDWEIVASLDKLAVQPILVMARQLCPMRIELSPGDDLRNPQASD